MTRARNCVQVLVDFGGLPAGKAMLKLCGIDCGPVRLPLRTLSRDRIREMEKALEAIGWDELRCK
jgi:N-acetylneuraminate lyase